jgi:uncharacterized membrane protein YedE/YeeE
VIRAGGIPVVRGPTRLIGAWSGRGYQAAADRTYRRSMLRIVLLILAVIFVVFVAAAVVRTLIWLALIALIVAALGLLLVGVRRARGSARRDQRRS